MKDCYDDSQFDELVNIYNSWGTKILEGWHQYNMSRIAVGHSETITNVAYKDDRVGSCKISFEQETQVIEYVLFRRQALGKKDTI